MSVTAEQPDVNQTACSACEGSKGAPIAAVIHLTPPEAMRGVTFVLCEECGRDVANALGFMCIKDGGWSKLEPRKRKAPR